MRTARCGCPPIPVTPSGWNSGGRELAARAPSAPAPGRGPFYNRGASLDAGGRSDRGLAGRARRRRRDQPHGRARRPAVGARSLGGAPGRPHANQLERDRHGHARRDLLHPDQALRAAGERIVRPRALPRGRRPDHRWLVPLAARRPPRALEQDDPRPADGVAGDGRALVRGRERGPRQRARQRPDQGADVLPELPARLLPADQHDSDAGWTSTMSSTCSSGSGRSSR